MFSGRLDLEKNWSLMLMTVSDPLVLPNLVAAVNILSYPGFGRLGCHLHHAAKQERNTLD